MFLGKNIAFCESPNNHIKFANNKVEAYISVARGLVTCCGHGGK
jgi:hypothetical protein